MRKAPGRGRIIVTVAALVFLGATAGIAADRVLQGRPAAHTIRLTNGTSVRFPDAHADPIEIFDRAVGLRPEQRTRVAAILERRQTEVNAAWHEARTRFKATVDSVIAEIEAELEPEQADRFRVLIEELHGPHRERLLHH